MEIMQILGGIVSIILALYYYFTKTFNFWKSRGVQGPRPILGFGTIKDITFKRTTMGDYVTKLYNDYKDEPLIGIFASRKPILIVKDLDLLKDVLIKDFSTFGDRGLHVFKKAEPLSEQLFNLEYKKWQLLRAQLTPIFTSHKLKQMFSLIYECSEHLIDYMEKLANKNEPIEMSDIMIRYINDVNGSCFFGIDINNLCDTNNEILRVGKTVLRPDWSVHLRGIIKLISPSFYNICGYILPDMEYTTFFTRLVMDVIRYKKKNNINRHDFIDLLLDLKKNSDENGEIEFTDSFIIAQAFLFFFAGFDTSATSMANMFYELALNQNIQDKLREEINEEYVKYGDFTYESIKNMKYLEKVFKETLRKYPSKFLSRQSNSNYTFNNGVTIPKGQKVYIPIYAIHHDPRIYPKPHIFDPERFNNDAVQSRHPMSFLNFGTGPRNCIGKRFANYQVKLGVIKILQKFKVVPCEKTTPYVFDESMIITTGPKGGIYLKILKINEA